MMNVNKRTLKYNRMAKQAGMTLIELTVVLLILVGLAGLLVPYVGSFNEKTNDTTNASNVNALNDAVNRYIVLPEHNDKLPANFDTLINAADVDAATATGGCATSTNTTAGAPYCGLSKPAADLFAANPYDASATTADNIVLNSLISGGLNTFANNSPASTNKTLSGLAGATDGLTLDTATTTFTLNKVQGLTPAAALAISATFPSSSAPDHLAFALGGSPTDYDETCYDYIAVGVGDSSKMIGSTLQGSPIAVNNGDDFGSPLDYYNHYVAIIKVDKNNDATQVDANGNKCSAHTDKAKFLGVAQLPTTANGHLSGISQSLGTNAAHTAARNEI